MKQNRTFLVAGVLLALAITTSIVLTGSSNSNSSKTNLAKCEKAVKGPLYTDCYVLYYKSEVKEKGFKTALNDFTAYTRKTNDIEGACHLIAHKLGETLWEDYLANVEKIDPTVCSYGVIHGAFIQAAKYLTPTKFSETLVGACDISPDPAICVHGFGHALAEAKVTPTQANDSCQAINSHYKDKDFYVFVPAACSEGYQMGLADHAEYLQDKDLGTMYESCKAFNELMFNGCAKAAVMTYSRYQPNDLARDLKLKEMINFCKANMFENCNRGIGRGLNEAFPPYLVSIKKQAEMMEKYCSQTDEVKQCIDGLLGQRIFATNYGYKEAKLLCEDTTKLKSLCREALGEIPSTSPNKKSSIVTIV